MDYAESFDFRSLVCFGKRVVKIQRVGDDLDTFKGYDLLIEDIETRRVERHRFEAVAICTGHNHTPKHIPFEGLDKFEGRRLHTHAFKGGEENASYKEKVVLVVGVGNSAGDVAAELAPIARQVYLSSRREGTWLIRRTGPSGYPIDSIVQRRGVEASLALLPYRVRCSLIEMYIEQTIGHRLIGLKPKGTRYFSQHVMVNDLLPTAIHLGQVKVRGPIERFTRRGVVFANEQHETPIDVVICGTGYRLSFPFLEPNLVSWSGSGRIDLYKHVFDPSQPRPECLAFIGLTQPVGSLPPIAEIQARWFAHLLARRCRPLPSVQKMKKEIADRRKKIEKRYGSLNVDRYTFQADWLDYMNTVAGEAGVAPSLWRYLFTSPRLWWRLVWCPAIPAQYRLEGPGARPEMARHLIATTKQRIMAPYNTKSGN